MRRFLKLSMINATWNFYGSDKNREHLETQLIILKMYAGESAIASVSSIKEFLNANGPASFSETATCTVLVKLTLVMPATNALSERSFSVQKRIKNYLRSTMTQKNGWTTFARWCRIQGRRRQTDVANDFYTEKSCRLSKFLDTFQNSIHVKHLAN